MPSDFLLQYRNICSIEDCQYKLSECYIYGQSYMYSPHYHLPIFLYIDEYYLIYTIYFSNCMIVPIIMTTFDTNINAQLNNNMSYLSEYGLTNISISFTK